MNLIRTCVLQNKQDTNKQAIASVKVGFCSTKVHMIRIITKYINFKGRNYFTESKINHGDLVCERNFDFVD